MLVLAFKYQTLFRKRFMGELKELKESSDQHERYIVPGLVRGLAVLQVFSEENQELGIAEIARQIKASRSTAFRLVYTLESLGFLQRTNSSKRYRIGSRVLNLGYSYLSSLDLIELATPILEGLRDSTRTSSHLIIRDGGDIVFVARCSARAQFASTVGVGTRFPAYATAPGRVLLSSLSTSEVVALFEDTEMYRYTENTPDSLGKLVQQLEQDKKESSIISWGFFDPTVANISAPVMDKNKTTVAAISASCPIGTYPKQEFETEIRQIVEQAGVSLSQTLGH